MRGDEVHARRRAAAVALVQVRAAEQPRADLRGPPALAAPEGAHRVAVLAVPLAPAHREVPHLVAALAQVPRLGDQLHALQRRVLVHHGEEAAEAVHLVEAAREGRREVEAEPVDVHLGDPVAERVHDQTQRLRVTDVEGVPRARVVEIEARVFRDEAVVRPVVDALEAQRRAFVVALGRVVVDDVEDDLDTRRVERLDHLLELPDLVAHVVAGAVGHLGREERDGVVAPVVSQAALGQVLVLREVVHGQELHRGHAETDEVLEDGGSRDPRVRPAQLGGNVGVAHREALHVRLVDDRLAERGVRRLVTGPIERRVDDDAQRRGALIEPAHGQVAFGVHRVVREAAFRPVLRPAHRLRVRIEEHAVVVEALPGLRVPRAVDA